VEGLVDGRAVAIDLVAGREIGQGRFEQGGVFRAGEGFDGGERVQERGAKSGGVLELLCPGGAEAVEAVRGRILQQHDRLRGQGVFMLFEDSCKHRPVNIVEKAGVREGLK